MLNQPSYHFCSYTMGKKKAPVFRDGSANQINRDDGKIKAIRTWNDIEHDSEDDFHDEREKVLLENDVQNSDEESEAEVFGLGLDDDEEEDEDEGELSDDEIIPKKASDDEEEEDATWGKSKKAYYDADEGSDLDEMREEEEEALRIQKEHIATMDEADFMDDWGTGADADVEGDKELVSNVTKELNDITFDIAKTVAKRRKNISVAEKLKILQNESPELLDLLNEFKERTEIVEGLEQDLNRIKSKGKQDAREAQFLQFKHQLLLNYLTNVSFYFVLKASGTPGLRDHPVINSLVALRASLEKTEQVENKLQAQIDAFMDKLDAPELSTEKSHTATAKTKLPKKNKKQVAQPMSEDEDIVDMEEKEEDRDVFDIEQEFKSLKKNGKAAAKKRKRSMQDDFGELEALDEIDLEDKMAKKRSIRDYVAKIDSKQSRNQAKYQGDVDIPYKDRQNRREKSGVAQPQDASADLDDADFDEDDMAVADSLREEDEDDFYAQTKAEKEAKKAAKKEQYEAERAPIMEGDWEVEEGEKRLASYKILKNRGLTPKRKKEARNARVKNRNKYANKLKKLQTVRAVVKPLTGTYGGESTGIKSNVVKSVRF
ncbi:Sas10 C-terminal domain-containing protein [Dichotomocladium elegans]|nr:Sas10 C-terminal domain-containing protein [Dichotomocladium elegans]